jgi:pyruvate kinase
MIGTLMTLPEHQSKIVVATIGPASESPEMLERLIRAGLAMLVAGPSTHNPADDYRLEFLRMEEKR